ncbi:MAG: hypothetical protein GY940_09795 [bacterium]|nr:hypothetical protein [bacterium]
MYLTKSAKQLKEKELDKIITEAYKQGGDIMQTIAEGWLKEGRKEGEKKGIKKGIKEGKLEMAKRMKEKGMDIDTIAEISGLSNEQIMKL